MKESPKASKTVTSTAMSGRPVDDGEQEDGEIVPGELGAERNTSAEGADYQSQQGGALAGTGATSGVPDVSAGIARFCARTPGPMVQA